MWLLTLQIAAFTVGVSVLAMIVFRRYFGWRPLSKSEMYRTVAYFWAIGTATWSLLLFIREPLPLGIDDILSQDGSTAFWSISLLISAGFYIRSELTEG